MKAFLSYQTADKLVAASTAKLLERMGISAFMAHENIGVSEEWRLHILKELKEADIFVAILSRNYFESIYCTQESGVAVFRGMTILPLSIDGTIPEGFLSAIQSTKIDPSGPNLSDIIPGIAKHDLSFLIAGLINLVRLSGSYRLAEDRFATVRPYLKDATRAQIVELLTVSTKNDQVCNAGLCMQQYLPPLVKSHGRYMKRKDLKELKETLGRYNVKF